MNFKNKDEILLKMLQMKLNWIDENTDWDYNYNFWYWACIKDLADLLWKDTNLYWSNK